MPKFKSVTYGHFDFELDEEVEFNFVVSEDLPAEVIIASLNGLAEPFPFICECEDEKASTLIAKLLNEHYAKH